MALLKAIVIRKRAIAWAVVAGLCCFGTAFGQKARGRCEEPLVKVISETSWKDDFWNSRTTRVNPSDESTEAVTLSFDSELTWADVVKWLVTNPQTKDKFFGALANQNVTLADWATGLRMTKKQFLGFALKPGVEKNRESYSLTEVKLGFMARWFDAGMRDRSELASFRQMSANGNELHLGLQRVLTDALIEAGYPIESHIDGRNIELTHKSWSMNPEDFRLFLTQQLHREFSNPQSHLHIGVPAILLNRVQAVAVARAIEMRQILALAAADAREDQKLSYACSILSNMEILHGGMQTYRGTIKLELEAWREPVVSHNFEIRQWLTIEDGLENISLIATLVQHGPRLKTFMDRYGAGPSDPYTQNLPGALKYAGILLSDSPVAANRELGSQLIARADRMEANGEITPKDRVEVQRLIQKTDLLGILDDLDIYLLPEGAPPRHP